MNKLKILNFQDIAIEGKNVEFINYPLRRFKRESNGIYIVFLRRPEEYLNCFLKNQIEKYNFFPIIKNIERLDNIENLVKYLKEKNFIPVFNPQTFCLDVRKRLPNAIKNLELFDYVVPYNEIEYFAGEFNLKIIKPKINHKSLFDDEIEEFIYKDTKLYKYSLTLWSMIKNNNYQSLQKILKYKGNVDNITQNIISGWAFVREAKEPCEVELYLDGEKIQVTLANIFRPDLKEKKVHPTGNCGFVFKLDDIKISEKSKLEVKIKNSNFKLKFGEKVKKYFKGEL